MVCEDVNPRSNSGTVELDEVVTKVAACIAPTIDEVADWHFVDQALARDWDRPLVRLLRFFVEPPRQRGAPEVQLCEDSTDGAVVDDVVVDLVTSEILDLTSVLHRGEELAS